MTPPDSLAAIPQDCDSSTATQARRGQDTSRSVRTLDRLKQHLASAVVSSVAFPTPRSHPSALFIAPSGSGSFGDEAMVTASIQLLRSRGFERFGIIYPGLESNWSRIPGVTDIFGVEIIYFYSTNPEPELKVQLPDLLVYSQLIQTYSHIFCVGADVLDGFYCEDITLALVQLLDLAVILNPNITVLGFSINDHPTPNSILALNALPETIRLCCRDPLSHQRLASKLNRSVELVADVAFLLQPTPQTESLGTESLGTESLGTESLGTESPGTIASDLLSWLHAQQAQNHLLIGLNTSSIFPSLVTDLQPTQMVKCYVDLLLYLSSIFKDLSILLLPHDHRGDYSDIRLATMVYERLPPYLRAITCTTSIHHTAADIKAYCKPLDLVITGRMHVAIAALGQGVPTLGITYQGKFAGLYQHFGLQDCTIAPEVAFQGDGLISGTLNMLQRLEDLRSQIAQAWPQVEARARANFSGVF